MKWLIAALLGSCLFACGGAPEELAKGEERSGAAFCDPTQANCVRNWMLGDWCQASGLKVTIDQGGNGKVVAKGSDFCHSVGEIVFFGLTPSSTTDWKSNVPGSENYYTGSACTPGHSSTSFGFGYSVGPPVHFGDLLGQGWTSC